ncbi:MAG: hypothetical protein Q4C49_01705 [Bacillota bacterium]|nr:hypothetical protein [Bacillota bacterium]
MRTFLSKRNVVILEQGIVVKTMNDPSLLEKEVWMYQQLEKYNVVPKLLKKENNSIFLEYKDCLTYLDVLLEQEQTKFDKTPWEALVQYLKLSQQVTGFLPMDCNLRNFLWDGKQIFAIDFEEYGNVSLTTCLEKISAYILLYDPIYSSVKQEIVNYYVHQYGMDWKRIDLEQEKLQKRRAQKRR